MQPKLVVITGPTASGKTALGVMLAQRLGGEVVSADSMQIYRGMDIGTAKPTPEEMQGVPHHMIDIADPAENYSVSRYAAQAVACVDDIRRLFNQLLHDFKLDNYLFDMTEKDLSPKEVKRIRRLLKQEMYEIFNGRNMPAIKD